MKPMTPHNANILIAAENPASASTLEGLLRGAGYANVRLTTDAREIVPLHSRWPYELLILDMNMRVISSLDVLAALTPRIDTGRLSVVALLDEQNSWLENQARLLGAKDAIRGSLDRAQVLEVVGATLRYRNRVA